MKRKSYFFRIIIAFCKFSVTGLISGLINYGWSYEQIKEFVTKQSMQAIAQ